MPAVTSLPVPGFIPLAFFDMLGLAAMGAPLIAVLCEIRGKTLRKVFYDKLAMQTAGMGVIAGVLSLLGGGTCAAFGVSRYPGLKKLWTGYPMESMVVGASLAFFFLMLLVYRFTWKSLKKSKGLHIALGLLSSLGTAAVIISLGLAARSASAVILSGEETPLGLFGAASAPGESLLWPVLAACLGWCLSYAGAMAMVYMIHRRDKDDFGRDYYSFAMPAASRWAVTGLGVLVVALAWFVTVLPPDLAFTLRSPGAPYYWGGLLGVLAMCGVLWSILGQSSKPMRLKGLALLAAFGAWGAHSLAFMILFKMYVES